MFPVRSTAAPTMIGVEALAPPDAVVTPTAVAADTTTATAAAKATLLECLMRFLLPSSLPITRRARLLHHRARQAHRAIRTLVRPLADSGPCSGTCQSGHVGLRPRPRSFRRRRPFRISLWARIVPDPAPRPGPG